MSQQRRTNAELEGDREAQRAAATLGGELRATRIKRRLTQQQVADRIGISRARCSGLERGEGTTAPLSTWFRAGVVIGRPIAVSFSRDSGAPLVDAGHAAGQELILRLARSFGRIGSFELRTRAARDSGSADVGIRDDRCRVLILIELWNALTDLGAAARSTARKLAEAETLAEFRGYRVASCWLLLDTAANRTIVRSHPEVLRAMFRGSSALWVRALTQGGCPPSDAGVAWIDVRSGRITELRLPA
ncbi:MAG TPA: helix-turn-helix transcriptional regulator [Candidatus Limnocylindrales bacterium]|nr:helix-turn-helix transcriptional regulator [Candidatus Limnocylindrales bacterium]